MVIGTFRNFKLQIVILCLFLLVGIMTIWYFFGFTKEFTVLFVSIAIFLSINLFQSFEYPNIQLIGDKFHITFFNKDTVLYSISEFDNISRGTDVIGFFKLGTVLYINFKNGDKYLIQKTHHNSLANVYELNQKIKAYIIDNSNK